MTIATKSLPELRRERELVAYELWGGRSELGLEIQPFLGREVWANELDKEIERREWEEKYPEHAKLKSIPEIERNAIGRFIEWLEEWGYVIRDSPDIGEILSMAPERWLAEYFGIDRAALSKEKDQMYQELVRGG